MTELTKTELQEKLTELNIEFLKKDTVEVLNKLMENYIMSQENTGMEEIVISAIKEVIEAGGKYNERDLIKTCIAQVEDQNAIFDFVAENGKRIAMDEGLIENAEDKKTRLAEEATKKAEILDALNAKIDEVEELPTDSEGVTALLTELAEASGATVAKARIELKKVYDDEGTAMPKKVSAPKGTQGYKGKAGKICEFVVANPEATEDELVQYCTDNELSKDTGWAKNLMFFANQVRSA